MYSPEEQFNSTEEVMLRNDIDELFQNHAFIMGVNQDYENPDQPLMMVLGGKLTDSSGNHFDVQVWCSKYLGPNDSITTIYFAGSAYGINNIRTRNIQSGESLQEKDLRNIRFWLKETLWESDYSSLLASHADEQDS